MVTGSRDTTTVATQALYLLNDPFVRRQSLDLAERLLGRTDLRRRRRVDLAYRLTLGRPATRAEIERRERLPRRLRVGRAADRVAAEAEPHAGRRPDRRRRGRAHGARPAARSPRRR